MTNKVQTPENDLMVETKGKLEIFFDKYGDKLLKAVIGIAIAAVVIFLAISIVKGSKQKSEQAAQAALTVALTSDATFETYVDIAATYEGTAAANTAVYVAGAEMLKAGDIEAAKAMLAKYKDGEGVAAEVINGLVYTLRGDIAVEENDLQSAADLFGKALAASADVQTWENNSAKLALVYAAMGDAAKAEQTYKALVARFPELKQKYSKYIAE
jgi:tetratricopeptide (TPR) repeat protein